MYHGLLHYTPASENTWDNFRILNLGIESNRNSGFTILPMGVTLKVVVDQDTTYEKLGGGGGGGGVSSCMTLQLCSI